MIAVTVPGWLVPLAQRREVLLAGLLLTVALLLWVVRRIARSERPDDALSNLVMLVGLGWSSEAVWEISRNRLHFPLGLTLLLFFVFEALLSLAMIRAKRHMRQFAWPGRFGTTAWTVAVCMSGVAGIASHSVPEAVLRMVIPLLVTKQWWDGLVGGAAQRPADASTWRWTPRRLLLALGAIEPGERDVQTVHRERLIQQMTTLYYKIQHGSGRLRTRRVSRLARMSLTADDAVIAEVRQRGDRALWFEPDHTPETTTVSPPVPIPAINEPVTALAPTPPAVATPSITAPRLAEPQPSGQPATMPEPVTATRTEPVPTPAEVAARVTPSPTTIPLRPTATRLAPAGVSKPKPRKTAPTAPAEPLAASAADTPVTEPKPAQMPLPLPVDPALLAKAREIATQYRTETGTPIKAGQLAARLRVNSELATQALAVLDLGPNNPNHDTTTANGTPAKADR
ncbi:hypothetical protein [Mangrovihabitans endophyticus]|uniref:Uncharacterized protein n=1 Tax=Mangrovihabitans endophyticus TaxID=1751298 RepID=A0A8J3C5E1_9ACTN|nr:hypothetical protein [Mangrovihabitans endophyticus]GGL09775.1 hypothetical protein GCM10012284_50610 [Mangrovihabitans endophyticus]